MVLAEVKLAPPSMASEHPSPSESKSKRFGIPSASVSISAQVVAKLKVAPLSFVADSLI